MTTLSGDATDQSAAINPFGTMSSSASPKTARTTWGVRRERPGTGIAPTRAPWPRSGLEIPCRAPGGKRTHPASAMKLLAFVCILGASAVVQHTRKLPGGSRTSLVRGCGKPTLGKPLPDPIPMKVQFPVGFALAASSPAASAGGFASLFDRETLNDWRNSSTRGETKVVGYDVHFTIDPAPDGKLPHCSSFRSSRLPPALRRAASCYRTSRPSRPHPTDE